MKILHTNKETPYLIFHFCKNESIKIVTINKNVADTLMKLDLTEHIKLLQHGKFKFEYLLGKILTCNNKRDSNMVISNTIKCVTKISIEIHVVVLNLYIVFILLSSGIYLFKFKLIRIKFKLTRMSVLKSVC